MDAESVAWCARLDGIRCEIDSWTISNRRFHGWTLLARGAIWCV